MTVRLCGIADLIRIHFCRFLSHRIVQIRHFILKSISSVMKKSPRVNPRPSSTPLIVPDDRGALTVPSERQRRAYLRTLDSEKARYPSQNRGLAYAMIDDYPMVQRSPLRVDTGSLNRQDRLTMPTAFHGVSFARCRTKPFSACMNFRFVTH